MEKLNSCKAGIEQCISQRYFSIAYLHKEEKTMNMHIHDSLEVYFAISGGRQFFIDNQIYDIKEGDYL